jgi:hypothetical protein
MTLRRRLFVSTLLALPGSFAAGGALAADPTTADCLAASDASLRLGNEHKLRSERAQLLVCGAASCPADIRNECLRRVDEVNAQIPTIAFSAKDGSGADLSAVKVTMDGELLVERLEGTALSMDPGEHTFSFEAAGLPPVSKKLVLVEGQKDRREVVVLGVPAAPVQPPPPGGSGLGTQRVLAIVAGGVAIAGLGVGTAFGLVAASQKSSAQSVCPAQCATADGVNRWNTAVTSGNVATVGFVVAGVAAAGAVALWLTAPRAAGAVQVGVGPGGLGVRGVF